MTESEARQYLKRLQELNREFERDCNCEIKFSYQEKFQPSNKLRYIIVNEISLKIS